MFDILLKVSNGEGWEQAVVSSIPSRKKDDDKPKKKKKERNSQSKPDGENPSAVDDVNSDEDEEVEEAEAEKGDEQPEITENVQQ